MLVARLIALLAVFSLTVSVRAATAQTTLVTVRLGILPSISAAQAFYAQSKGFFKNRGLDVQTLSLNSGAAIAAAVAGGSLDVGIADVISIANARDRGIAFSYIAPANVITPAYPQAGLLVRGDSAIFDAKGLTGKTVAVNAIHTISTVLTQAWVDNNGGDAKSLKFIEVPIPQMNGFVERGTVDAAFSGDPFFTIGKAAGMRVLPFSRGGLAPTVMTAGWFAEKSWIDKHREVAVQFAAAIREATLWANANRPATEPLLVEALKLPADLIHSLTLPANYGETLRAADIQPMLNGAVKYGALGTPIRADDLIAKLK